MLIAGPHSLFSCLDCRNVLMPGAQLHHCVDDDDDDEDDDDDDCNDYKMMEKEVFTTVDNSSLRDSWKVAPVR